MSTGSQRNIRPRGTQSFQDLSRALPSSPCILMAFSCILFALNEAHGTNCLSLQTDFHQIVTSVFRLQCLFYHNGEEEGIAQDALTVPLLYPLTCLARLVIAVACRVHSKE